MRQALITVVGFLYGLVLAFFGFGVAGGGHGAMIPLYIFGSPFFFPLLFFAPVVLWTIAALLLAGAERPVCRLALFCLVGLHYLGIAPYLFLLGDWEYLYKVWDRAPVHLAIPFGCYLVGQFALWIAIARLIRNPQRAEQTLGADSPLSDLYS